MLEIIDATLGFGGRRLFEPISLKIPRGEVMLLTAPSGAGKSTLLHWICGTSPEELEAKGEISLDGKVLTGLKAEERNIGIIFQDGLLFPHLSVWENLAFGMKGGGSKSTRRQKVESALAEIGLAGLGGRDPLTLSGGQKLGLRCCEACLLNRKPCYLMSLSQGLMERLAMILLTSSWGASERITYLLFWLATTLAMRLLVLSPLCVFKIPNKI